MVRAWCCQGFKMGERVWWGVRDAPLLPNWAPPGHRCTFHHVALPQSVNCCMTCFAITCKNCYSCLAGSRRFPANDGSMASVCVLPDAAIVCIYLHCRTPHFVCGWCGGFEPGKGAPTLPCWAYCSVCIAGPRWHEFPILSPPPNIFLSIAAERSTCLCADELRLMRAANTPVPHEDDDA